MYYNGEEDKICFADIHEFMECPAIPGGEYASVQEYAESVTGGNALEKISPLEIVKAMEKYVEAAEELLAKLQEKSETKEFAATLYDIDLMCRLGNYFALKERAAMNLSVYQRNHDEARKEEAIDQAKTAMLLCGRNILPG